MRGDGPLKAIGEGEFDEFLGAAMKFDPDKDHRVMVFCEECNDVTIIGSKSGVSCGHRPKWLDKLAEWAEKHQ